MKTLFHSICLKIDRLLGRSCEKHVRAILNGRTHTAKMAETVNIYPC
jgi:hypothetical protein